jgi:hypothetical protein
VVVTPDDASTRYATAIVNNMPATNPKKKRMSGSSDTTTRDDATAPRETS